MCVSDEEFQAAAPAVVQHESTLKRHSSLPLAENKYASFLVSEKEKHGSVASGIKDFQSKAKAFPPRSGTGVPNFPETVDYDEPCGETCRHAPKVIVEGCEAVIDSESCDEIILSRIDPVFAGIEIKIGEGATAYAIGDVVDPVPMPMDVDADDAGDFLNVFETASNSSESSCKSDQPKRHKTKTKAEGVFGQLDSELMAVLGVETTEVEQLMIEIENATNVHAQDVSELPTMMPTVENASVAAPTRPLATVTKTLDQIVKECGLQLNGNMIWTSTDTGLGYMN